MHVFVKFFNISTYVDKVKPVSTSLGLNIKLRDLQSVSTVEENEVIRHVLYAFAVGSLMYAIVYMMPDKTSSWFG